MELNINSPLNTPKSFIIYADLEALLPISIETITTSPNWEYSDKHKYKIPLLQNPEKVSMTKITIVFNQAGSMAEIALKTLELLEGISHSSQKEKSTQLNF